MNYQEAYNNIQDCYSKQLDLLNFQENKIEELINSLDDKELKQVLEIISISTDRARRKVEMIRLYEIDLLKQLSEVEVIVKEYLENG